MSTALAHHEAQDLLRAIASGTHTPAADPLRPWTVELAELLAQTAERAAISDLQESLSWTQALVHACDVAGVGEARSRRARAHALSYANRFDEAFAMLAEGAAIALSRGETLESAQCRLMQLHSLARQGKLDEAIAIGEEARAAFIEAGSLLDAARADINIGVAWRMKDRPELALARFELAAGPVASSQSSSSCWRTS
jgi:tetratricopeptide (TPR) repeat protein